MVSLYTSNAVCFSLFSTITYTEQWRDFISVFGTLATLVAFAIAIKQIDDAKRIVEAERAASRATANHIHTHYFRHLLTEAQRFFTRARDNLKAARQGRQVSWTLASEHLSSTTELLEAAKRTLGDDAPQELDGLCEGLRTMSHECDRMAGGGKNFRITSWNQLHDEFAPFILDYLQPLPGQE